MIKPILIPADKMSEIGSIGGSALLLIDTTKEEKIVEGVPRIDFFDIILIDTEAEIVEGCIVYESDTKNTYKYNQCGVSDLDFKVISATDSGGELPLLSGASIKLLFNYYNEFGCMPESVDVKEEEEDCKCKKSKDNPRVVSKKTMTCLQCNKSILKTIKLNRQGEVEITIPKVEETNLDIELKAYGIPKKVWKESQQIAEYHDKCMESEEKLYTEEEVRELCIKSLSMGFDLNNCPYPRLDDKTGKEYWEEWFNKNKK
jgi:hypothetical protein